MENTPVHQLAQLLGETDSEVKQNAAFGNISVTGLLNAVKDGKITREQLVGKDDQLITLGEIRKIAGPADPEEDLEDLPDSIEDFLAMLADDEDEDEDEGAEDKVA
jgi:hypothetical protein